LEFFCLAEKNPPGEGARFTLKKRNKNMKTKMIDLMAVVMAAMMIAPAMAATDIQMQLVASGVTSVNEIAVVYGPHNGVKTATAQVHEGIENTGTISMVKNIYNPKAWYMVEAKSVWGTGTTSIVKDVNWWTVSPALNKDGTLMHPTVANIYTQFATDTLLVQEEIHNTANKAPAGTINQYLANINTNDDFGYYETVGINMPTQCTVVAPTPIATPSCIMGC
jgi:hypothetical protein